MPSLGDAIKCVVLRKLLIKQVAAIGVLSIAIKKCRESRVAAIHVGLNLLHSHVRFEVYHLLIRNMDREFLHWREFFMGWSDATLTGH